MNNQLIDILKMKIASAVSLQGTDAEVARNMLKEELQYHVLNFLYHHAEYGTWIMYGGSALRMCHDLNRMSVDLDFEVAHEIKKEFLDTLKGEIKKHFSSVYGTDSDFLSITTSSRGLTLKFTVGEELSFGYSSKQVHIKIDLNHFVLKTAVKERIPIAHGQLAFVIITYNLAGLMASKIAAILLRKGRGIGKEIYGEKGRDIYDLLWYMGKRTIPDLDYLGAKGVAVDTMRGLFDRLTIRMNEVNDTNLKQDLSPLFLDQTFIKNWLAQWRESYVRLANGYSIYTVHALQAVRVEKDFNTKVLSFVFEYATAEGAPAICTYVLSRHWLQFREGDIDIPIDRALVRLVPEKAREKMNDRMKQYITLFYGKTEAYLKKSGRELIGDSITTKMIRMDAANFNPKKEIILTKSALLTCKLEDVLP